MVQFQFQSVGPVGSVNTTVHKKATNVVLHQVNEHLITQNEDRSVKVELNSVFYIDRDDTHTTCLILSLALFIPEQRSFLILEAVFDEMYDDLVDTANPKLADLKNT